MRASIAFKVVSVGLVAAEADNQVIGLVGLGAGVLDLGVDDLENRRVRPA